MDTATRRRCDCNMMERMGRGRRRSGRRYDGVLTAVGAVWTVMVVAGLCAGGARGFNIDTRSPRVFQGPDDSYFGFSVSLHSNRHGDWLLVGAPKATDIHQPSLNASGALYQCPLNQESPCFQVELDTRGNEYKAQKIVPMGKLKVRKRYTDQKDYQWLGMSVDSHQHGDGGVVVCAPRWADKWYRRSGFLMTNGACYITDGDVSSNSSRRLLPLTHNGKQIHHRTREYIYAFGQAGMSAHYTQNGEKLLLGAPGIRDWTGGVVEFSAKNEYVTYPDRIIPKNGYLGYTLMSGRFYGTDEIYYVTGGPRIDMHGRVIVYTGRFYIKVQLEGRQMGEYFGGAICVADVNQDGYDDLLVGAPLYKAREYEEGRVAVFLMRRTHVFDHVVDLLGSEIAGSRFGSAITSADLTLDGYPDVLIGAPYEDEGRGVVYVYNGYRHGVRPAPSQKITGSTLRPDLRGFGYSLTTPRTMSHQHYPDVAVGSYSSDMAVVLSTRPLLVVQLNASTYPDLINPNVVHCHLNNNTYSPRSCLAVGVAFKFTGLGLPDAASFTVTVRADVERNKDDTHRLPLRGGFRNGTVNKTGITHHALPEFSIRVDKWPAHRAWKDTFIFVLNKHVVDVITPMSISIDVDLVTNFNNRSNVPQPMLDKYCQRSMVLAVPFDKFCGEDNHCKTNLQLHASVMWPSPEVDYVILGQKEPISLELHVNNVGEKAYMTTLIILHPPQLEYAGTRQVGGGAVHPHITCTPHASPEDIDNNNGSAALVCDVGNPIPDMQMRSVVVVLGWPRVYHPGTFPHHELRLHVATRTRSQEAFLGDNDVTLVLPVKVSAEMDLSGVSYPEQHVYEVTPDNSSAANPNETTQLVPVISEPEVYHIYDLRNEGPGLFPGGHVEVMIPVESNDGNKLLDYTVEILDDAVTKAKPALYGNDKGRARRDAVYENSTSGSEDDLTSADPLTLTPPGALFGRSRLLPLDVFCGTAQCETARFDLGPLNAGESVTISILLRLFMGNLTVLQDTGAVRVVTRVLVRGLMPVSTLALADLKVATLVTPRHAPVPDGSVPWWVVAASVGIGVFLLLLVIGVLYKLGFFTRAEREELVKLIGQNEENEEHESRMLRVGDNTEHDWESYDPWQPQNPETSLLIWHANGSISHNSREEYLAATRRSSSSTHDRNLNEKSKPNIPHHPEQRRMNGNIPNGNTSLPSTSGSSSSDRRDQRHSVTSHDDDVFCEGYNPRSFDIPNYLVIRPAEDSDEEQLFTELPEAIPNGHVSR